MNKRPWLFTVQLYLDVQIHIYRLNCTTVYHKDLASYNLYNVAMMQVTKVLLKIDIVCEVANLKFPLIL